MARICIFYLGPLLYLALPPTLGVSIQSPNYPNNYPSYLDKLYPIEVAVGKLVNIRFTSFDVEDHASCKYDYVSAVETRVSDFDTFQNIS